MKKNQVIFIAIISLVLIIGMSLLFITCNKKNNIQTIQSNSYDSGVVNNGNDIFFSITPYSGDSNLVKYDTNTNSQSNILTYNYFGINQIIYSQNGLYAYFQNEPEYQSNIYKNTIINLKDQNKYELDSNIIDLVFHKDNKIIYTYYMQDLDTTVLDIADIDGKNWKEYIPTDKLPMRYIKKIITDEQEQNIVLINDAHDFSELVGLYYIDSEKNITQVLKGKYVTDASFSPDGSKILIESQDPQENLIPKLFLYDIKSEEIKELNIKTFISKTAWFNEKTIILALPENIPDDYSSQQYFISQDLLVKLNLSNLKKDKINNADLITNISKILVDKNKNIYYQSDNTLYKIEQ